VSAVHAHPHDEPGDADRAGSVPAATLASLTTMRVGGPIRSVVSASSTDDLAAAIRDADVAGQRLLLIGGGSNLVGGDGGWDGTAILIRTRGVSAAESGDDVILTVAAGEDWDGVVAESVQAGWSGLETLSGVPGLAGATPVQNVGAYGADIAGVLHGVQLLDRMGHGVRSWPADALQLGYRDSALKHTDRYVVAAVEYRLRRSPLSGPVRYAQLAAALGVELGAQVPLADARAAVLQLRAEKGMLIDANDHDTWGVGSFFTNPVLPELPASLRHLPAGHSAIWPAETGQPAAPSANANAVGAAAPSAGVKISAAWLIGEAGFAPGFALPGSQAGLSAKHLLAITNRGGATGAQVRELADHIAAAVRDRFDVELHPEPRVL
jgi:UDP-N-acetylmuramate dehydrogenase